MTGDEQKLFRSFQKLITQQSKLQGSMAKTASQAEKVEKAGKKAGSTGAKAFRSAKKQMIGLGVTAVGTVASLQAVLSVLREISRIKLESAGGILAGEAGARKLGQLATTKGEFDTLIKASRDIRTTEGLKRQTAQELVFELQSAGKLDEAKLFASLNRIDFSPRAAVEAVQKLQANFPDAGTDREALANILSAARFSPVGGEQIGRAASVAATSAAEVGFDATQTLAVVSQFAKPFKTAQVGAERLKTFSDQLLASKNQIALPKFILDKLGGLELAQLLPGLAAAGLLRDKQGDITDVKGFIGESKEAQAAQAQLRKQGPAILETIVQQRADVRAAGTTGDVVERAIAVTDTPELNAARRQRIEEQRVKVQREEELGREELGFQAGQLERERQRREEGMSEFVNQGITQMSNLGRMAQPALQFISGGTLFGDDDEQQSQPGRAGIPSVRAAFDVPVSGDKQMVAELRAAVQGLMMSSESMNDAARSAKGGPALAKPDEDQ